MEPILQRISPVIISWTLVAIIGLAISVLTFFLLRKNLHIQEKVQKPIGEVIEMLEHNELAEVIRGCAQVIAIMISVAYLFDLLPGQAIGWALVSMNISIVVSSLNEFITALRLLKED